MQDYLDRIDRFARRGLWMCLVWPLLAAPVPLFGPPVLPPELQGVADLEIEEFDLSGMTVAEIFRSVESNLLTEPGLDGPALAMTHSVLDWDWRRGSDGNGACRVADPAVTTRFRVVLPRLISTDYPAEVATQWRLYRRALEMHEARHVRITLDYAGRIRRALADASCEQADAVAKQLKHDMELAQDAFDDEVCLAWNNGDDSKAAQDACAELYLLPRDTRATPDSRMDTIVE